MANLIVFYQRGCRQDKEGLQRRIADSVVAPFNWCEITFFGGGASNRLTPEIIEFDTVDELRPVKVVHGLMAPRAPAQTSEMSTHLWRRGRGEV